MAIVANFDTIRQRTLEISSSLEQLNAAHAEQEAQQLYRETIGLVEMEANNQPVANGDALMIANKLNDVISTPGIEHQVNFLRAISKVYRIFLELTWTHSWRQNQMPVHTDTRDRIIQSSDSMIALLRERQTEIGTQFEYSCAKQAAKCLTPSESIWKKYIDHLINLGEAAQGLSAFGILGALKAIAIDAGKDWISRWYPDVFQLRLLSTRIRTVQDFNTIIVPKLSHFKEKGGKHTLCLATIYMELINNPTVEEGVKTRVATGLAELLRLEDRDAVSCLLNQGLKKIHIKPLRKPFKEWAKREDRYFLTQILVLQYIEDLIRDGKYPDLNLREAVHALVELKGQTIHEDERRAIELKLIELSKEKKEVKQFIKETEEYLESTRGETRADDEVELAKADLQKAIEDQAKIEEEIKAIESIEPVLAELQQEKQELLARIETLLSNSSRG